MSTIKNRSEILFLYDVKYCNPNGDPLDANKPRIDEETLKCLVTDVRLKRTIRDYLIDKGYNGDKNSLGDIFVRNENGEVVTGEKRSNSYNNKADYINKFIDVRLFGGVSAPKKAKGKKKAEGEETTDKTKTFHFTGPVQFGMGKSLHPVKLNFIKGTGAFATKEESIQKTFREEYNITYGLIGFHGVINENAAKHVGTTDADIAELMEAIWNGTKSLLTRSKKGHMPRLLVKIDYKESAKGFFIGDLIERLVVLPQAGKTEDTFEDTEDFTIDVTDLNAVLRKYADKIEHIEIQHDDRLKLSASIHSIKKA